MKIKDMHPSLRISERVRRFNCFLLRPWNNISIIIYGLKKDLKEYYETQLWCFRIWWFPKKIKETKFFHRLYISYITRECEHNKKYYVVIWKGYEQEKIYFETKELAAEALEKLKKISREIKKDFDQQRLYYKARIKSKRL